MDYVGVVRNNDRYDRDLCLDCQVKPALFERQKTWFSTVRPSPLRKYVDALSFFLHLSRSSIKGKPGIFTVSAINEDRLAEDH